MNSKILLFFTLFLSLNLSGQIPEKIKTVSSIKSLNLIKSIKGTWQVVHISADNMEIDCENFESSLSKQLKRSKGNHSEIKEKFKNFCKNKTRKTIKVTDNYILDLETNEKTTFKLDDSLDENMVLTKDGLNEYKVKIIKLDDFYFRFFSSEKLWMEFKKIED